MAAEKEVKKDEKMMLRALSNFKRIEIIKLLSKGPMTIEDLSEKTRLAHWTIRHHLRELEMAGLIEREELREGAGRPKLVYKIAIAAPFIVMPPRGYLELTISMVEFIREYFGDKSKEVFFKIGLRNAEKMLENTLKDKKIKRMDINTFREIFVEDVLEKMIGGAEVVKHTKDRLIFRIYLCPYYELAVNNPEAVCEGMEAGFREGVARFLKPGLSYERTSCIAHGDAYCEFIVKKG